MTFTRARVSVTFVATEATLEQARGGDDRAFGELTDPVPERTEAALLPDPRFGPDAEDVLQETLLAAWRGLGQYEQRASLRTWLYPDRDEPVPERAAGQRTPAAVRCLRPGFPHRGADPAG